MFCCRSRWSWLWRPGILQPRGIWSRLNCWPFGLFRKLVTLWAACRRSISGSGRIEGIRIPDRKILRNCLSFSLVGGSRIPRNIGIFRQNQGKECRFSELCSGWRPGGNWGGFGQGRRKMREPEILWNRIRLWIGMNMFIPFISSFYTIL